MKSHRRPELGTHFTDKTEHAVALLSAVMHEINNPLQSLSEILYLLQQNSLLDKDSRLLVNKAREEMQRVQEVASNTLHISRTKLSFTCLDIRGTIDAVLQQLSSKADSANVLVARDFRPLPLVEGSESHLRQLFANVIHNAIEAAGPTGRVLVRVRPSRDLVTGHRAWRYSSVTRAQGLSKRQECGWGALLHQQT